MMHKSLLFRLVAMVVAMMCALGASAAEAYANYSNRTLTFYFDDLRSTRPDLTFDLNTGNNRPNWSNYSFEKVVFDPSFAAARPTSTYYWFGFSNVTTITGIEYLNTANVTDMSYMFYFCYHLTSLDVSNLNTANVTNMSYMFYYCRELTCLDLSSFNTANVTDMRSMFNDCSKLVTIYAGDGWSTAAVTSSDYMFSSCSSLVGGMGTTYNYGHSDAEYAHIDGGPSNPGYFTDINHPKEAYACYTADNTTLTFYYDSQRSTRPGTTYLLPEPNTYPGWYSDGTYTSITQVVFDPLFAGTRPTSTRRWFYYHSNLQSITGLNYLNTTQVTDMNSMFEGCNNLTSIDVSNFVTDNVTDMGGMFYQCRKLTSLDVTNFNTANVTNMSGMFAGLRLITDLDVRNFNTANVIEMNFMFSSCVALTTLDLSRFNTAKVKGMQIMFSGCSALTTIYVASQWTTDLVTNHNDMFKGCTKLVGGMGTTYDANHVDKAYAHIDGGTSNPGYLTEFIEPYACFTSDNRTLTFYYDSQRGARPGITYDLNTDNYSPLWATTLSTFDNTSWVVFDPSFADARPTSTAHWFEGMESLQSITGMKEYLNTSEVTTMQNMFLYCEQLTSLDLSGFNTEKVTDLSEMFYRCYGLTSLDLSSFSTANVTRMDEMFYECTNLTTIYVGSGWSTDAVTTSGGMFSDCTKLVGGKGTTYDANHVDKAYAHIDGGPSNPGYLTDINVPDEAYACYTSDNTTLTFYYDNQRRTRPGTTYDLNEGTNIPGWYSVRDSVTNVVFDSSFAEARPTSTASWFFNMENLVSITGIKEYLNTSEVTNMRYMFCGCHDLTSIDASDFNTSNVTDMSYMFASCYNLEGLDLSAWNTSNVTDMRYMFISCFGLMTLDLSGFNTSNVTNMEHMFQGCEGLTSLDVSSFNTAKVTNMESMFQACTGLTSLDLSGFNTAKVTNMELMFSTCVYLTTIYVGSGWNTDAVTASLYMFGTCYNLVGGKGTTYDANHTDKAYAHIDGGPSDPGYLTEAPTYLRGDVNGNGLVTIGDVTDLIDYLLTGNATGINVSAADCDLDGKVSIGDVTALIDYLLRGYWPED